MEKSPENGTAERQSSPELRNFAGGNPTQSENQTLAGNPDRFENWSRPPNFGHKWPEDQLPFWMLKKDETSQPELRNQAGGNLLCKRKAGPENQISSKSQVRFQFQFTKWIRTTGSIGEPIATKVLLRSTKAEQLKKQSLAILVINLTSITLLNGG